MFCVYFYVDTLFLVVCGCRFLETLAIICLVPPPELYIISNKDSGGLMSTGEIVHPCTCIKHQCMPILYYIYRSKYQLSLHVCKHACWCLEMPPIFENVIMLNQELKDAREDLMSS